MIASLHGGHAAGKTTLCQRLIAELPSREVRGLGEKRMPWFYEVGDGLLVTRRGENMSVHELEALVNHFHSEGRSVLYEHVYGGRSRWLEPSKRWSSTWLLLDTPPEVCLERAQARRKTGKTDPAAVYDSHRVARKEVNRAMSEGITAYTVSGFDQLVGFLMMTGAL